MSSCKAAVELEVNKSRASRKSNDRPNFLLHVAICNDARLNYNFLPWNRMVTRRIAILLLKMTDNSVEGKAELLPIISRE